MEKQYVIKCGTFIDGKNIFSGDGYALVISNGIIARVIKNTEIPSGLNVIHAEDKTVMPGLIDAHIHFMGMPQHCERMIWPQQMRLLKSVNDAKELLSWGFTTVRDAGGPNAIYLRNARKQGILRGIPRIISAGLIIAPTNNASDDPHQISGYSDYRTNNNSDFLICDGIDACLEGTRYAIRYGADFIKIFCSGNYAFSNCSDSIDLYTEDEIRTIVNVAQMNAGKPVSAHCMNDHAAEMAIQCGVNVIEHAIGVTEATAHLGAEKGVYFTSSLCFARSEPVLNEGIWDKMVNSYINIRKAGGILAIGSDMNTMARFPFGRNAMEAVLLKEYCGFSAEEAIRAITINGAIVAGVDSITGSLEEGKSADILILDGDPIKNISVLLDKENICAVISEGETVAGKWYEDSNYVHNRRSSI